MAPAAEAGPVPGGIGPVGATIPPMLNRLDDFPIHQTPEPIAHPESSDRNVYDRTFFNGYSPDGSAFFGIGIAWLHHHAVLSDIRVIDRFIMLANLVASFFIPGGMGLRDGGPLAIIFSLVGIGVAAFSLLMDFDMADQAVRAGVPATFAWYIAFGLMTTLVWLYIEILRLLSYLRQE